MADFEGNPFGDPSEINPFADAAVKQASSSDEVAPATDDYNPFSEDAKPKAEAAQDVPVPPPTISKKEAEKKKKKKPSGPKRPAASSFSEPAILQHDPDTPPAYTPAPNAFSGADAGLRKREEEIARKEAELADREKNIARLGPVEHPNNFPPFPKFCPIKPCCYINISEAVPPNQKWKMWMLTALLIFYSILLIINFAVSIAGVVKQPENNSFNYAITMGVALAYMLLFIPGATFCWWYPAYHAYRNDSSLAFMWFFFCMAFQCLGFVLNALGIPNLGACGFVLGASLFSSSSVVGTMYIVMGVLWLLALIPGVIAIVSLHRYYRSSGMTIQNATEEAMTGAAKNKYVRHAAKEAVKTGVKASVAAATD